MKKDAKKSPKSFRLPPELVEKIKQIAKETGSSESKLVEECVIQQLDVVAIGQTRFADLMTSPERLAAARDLINGLSQARREKK